jgi:hypothetical protein
VTSDERRAELIEHPLTEHPPIEQLRVKGPRAIQLYLLAIGVAALVTAAVASTVGVTILLGNSHKATQQRADQLVQGKQTQELARLLVECTTSPELREPPERTDTVSPRDCYLRQQANTASVVGDPAGPINTVAVAAAACGAAHPGDVPATLQCTRAAVHAR